MKLKTFMAATTEQAMRDVRESLGRDAIILSSEALEDGVRVMAAIEDAEDVSAAEENGVPLESLIALQAARSSLLRHGLEPSACDRILRAGAACGAIEPALVLAAGIDSTIRFAPLPAANRKPLFFLGPPGAGKTSMIARFAVIAKAAGRPVAIITTDTQRAGGVEQLQIYADRLGFSLKVADTPEKLRAAVKAVSAGESILIDSCGANPFDGYELAALRRLSEAADAEQILVVPAGGDPAEAAEIARAFALAGAERLLVTKLDLSKRLASLIVTAMTGSYRLCGATLSPLVLEPPRPITPVTLARLLVTDLAPMERQL
jgi:flagellar biosynthesis protein FlhF